MFNIIKTHIEELGSPFFKQNRVDTSLLQKGENLEVIYACIDGIKQGKNNALIKSELIDKVRGKNKEERFEELLRKAWHVVENEYNKKNKYVIGLHLSRYNKEINDILSEDYKKLELKTEEPKLIIAALRKKANGLFRVIDLCERKEKLLSLHNPKVIIRLNQQNNIIINKNKPKVDIHLLELSEQIEMLNLLQKMKQGEESQYIRNTNEIEEVQVISVNNNNNNIERIKTKNNLPEIEDKKTPSTADDILRKIQENLLKKQERHEQDSKM